MRVRLVGFDGEVLEIVFLVLTDFSEVLRQDPESFICCDPLGFPLCSSSYFIPESGARIFLLQRAICAGLSKHHALVVAPLRALGLLDPIEFLETLEASIDQIPLNVVPLLPSFSHPLEVLAVSRWSVSGSSSLLGLAVLRVV